jgi:type VI secretion system protein ImpB
MTSIFDKIKTVRKPRVQISYELEEGDATVKKELPFVVGVLGDFSGKPTKPLKNFKKRKFINIHGENFNEVMEKMSPGVEMRVKNTIKNDGSEMPVKLSFSNMDDFSPTQIAANVPALKKLLTTRSKLKDLLSKAERSENLEKKLEEILQSEDQLKSLSDVLGPQDSGEESTGDNSEGSEEPQE